MTEIIGVRFKDVGKIYYFSPNKNTVKCGSHVIVETARGVECGEVVIANREIEDSKVVQPLKSIIRIATDKDLETQKKRTTASATEGRPSSGKQAPRYLSR